MIILLPRLEDVHMVGGINPPGQWVTRPGTVFGDIGTSLRGQSANIDVNSIPNPWARALDFEIAFYDPGHVRHTLVEGEWRGLLALLALKLCLPVDLEAVPIIIPDSNQPDSPPFLRAIRRLMPTATLDPNTRWDNLDAIVSNKQAIGFTSPTTIVCTATNCFNRIANVPWFDGRYLNDPIPYLNATLKRFLVTWLEMVRSALLGYAGFNAGDVSCGRLLGRINCFIADVGVPQDDRLTCRIGAFGFSAGIFKCFDMPIVPDEGRFSDVELKPCPSKRPSKRILVIHELIADQWQMRTRDIVAYKTISLDTAVGIKGARGRRTDVAGQRLPENCETWHPEEFFLPKLYVIRGADAFPGSLPDVRGVRDLRLFNTKEAVTPILPLREELLTYLDAQDLGERISIEQQGESFIVSLDIPLNSPNDQGRNFTFRKKYDRQQKEVDILDDKPVLEVWPFFDCPAWKAHFTYFSTAKQRSTFFARPFHADGVTDSQVLASDHRNAPLTCITRTLRFPEGMVCSVMEPQSRALVSIGLILLKRPPRTTPGPDTWKIGIDFGTSNTTAFAARESAEQPSALQFDESLLLKVTDSGSYRTQLFDEFLPPETQKLPCQTIYQSFLTDVAQELPFLCGHIYFANSYRELGHRLATLHTNLKWGSEEERVHTVDFLLQFALQSAAQAVSHGASSVSWRFSYPSAFSRLDKRTFIDAWSRVIERVEMLTGLRQIGSHVAPKTESVAAAAYFANLDDIRQVANVNKGIVCMDIGGGSTDISIWQGNLMIYQTSLQFAARDILLRPLYANPHFLGKLPESEKSKVDADIFARTARSKVQQSFYTQVDTLLMSQGEAIVNNLHKIAGQADVQSLLQMVALAISGIVYYVGLILKKLNEDGSYHAVLPNLYFGGNGCRLLHWIAGKRYDPEGDVPLLLKEVLSAACGFTLDEKSKFIAHVSQVPKSEVAYGLVQDAVPLKQKEQFDPETYVAGMDFFKDGQQYPWSKMIVVEDFLGGLGVPEGLEPLPVFLEAFNRGAEKTDIIGKITADSLNPVRDTLQQELTNMKNLPVDLLRVRPIFILALQTLLEYRISDWKSRSMGATEGRP
jgi:hypothetical protein